MPFRYTNCSHCVLFMSLWIFRLKVLLPPSSDVSFVPICSTKLFLLCLTAVIPLPFLLHLASLSLFFSACLHHLDSLLVNPPSSQMASWEIVVRDGVLSTLLRQLMVAPLPWDLDPDHYWASYGRVPCTVADIENARLASPMWKSVIDSSPEWACMRPARWDYANKAGNP
ncbi:hypothetical protein M758_UG186500 [Ceratodon purpureus]|nr:hypothetical protein M758_UG186500 [Ceratodon purpureus]